MRNAGSKIKQRGLTVAMVALVMWSLAAAAQTGQWNVSQTDKQMQMEGTMDLGGGKTMKMFMVFADLGSSYIAFVHMAGAGNGPVTMVINGKKGEAEGAYRLDHVSAKIISQDGTVTTVPEREMQMPNVGPGAMSSQDALGMWQHMSK